MSGVYRPLEKGVFRVWRNGREYRYAYRGGGPRLKAEPGSPAYIAELAAAQAARHAPDTSRMTGLVTLFKASEDWREKLSTSTRKLWAPHLDRIVAHFGSLSVKQFDRADIRPDIIRWRNSRRSTPRAADTGIQVLSRVLSFGRDEGLLTINACNGIGALYDNDRSDIIWEPADVRKLELVASPQLMWAARLAMLTGLRQADCRELTWAEVGDLAIERGVNKSRRGDGARPRKVALIPVHAELRALLDELPRRASTVLTNTHGKPWKTGLSDSFADAAERAGVEKHFHDLRGTAATRFYFAGFNLREIAEIMGWEEASVERIVNRYVRRDAMLRARIERMDAGAARSG